jgi:hypothetical protein
MKSYFLQTQGQVASLREGTYAPVRRNCAGALTGDLMDFVEFVLAPQLRRRRKVN